MLPLISSHLTHTQAQKLLQDKYTDALYIYDTQILQNQIEQLISACKKNNIQPRFAMKANHNTRILEAMKNAGIHIDASSTYEAISAIDTWFHPTHIQLTSQQRDGEKTIDVLKQWVKYVATSIHQLQWYCDSFPESSVWVRINPGIWSWAFTKVNTWWPTSSFGIWHEYISQILEIATKKNVKITVLHTHIWSGSNPLIRQEAARMTCSFLPLFPDVHTIDLWWWIKIPRMPHDKPADIHAILSSMRDTINHSISTDPVLQDRFSKNSLQVEIEPGTFLVANAGWVLCRVGDITDTGKDGYTFLKLTTWMDAILRPAMYGAQHHIVPILDSTVESNTMQEYVIVWHCCESSDIFTPDFNNEDQVGTRTLPTCKIGDIILIEWAGAYCESMCAAGYNGYDKLPTAWI
jgi:diaminopimelate decarboxylase